MIGILFVLNTLLAFSTLLTTAMLQNHFRKIERSLDIYINPKAYKPKNEIKFISELVNHFKEQQKQKKDQMDIEEIIHLHLNQEKIGYFSYRWVQKVASNGKIMMWGILIIQIVLEVTGKRPGRSLNHFIFIVGSALLCMFFTLLSVIKNMHEKEKLLILTLQEYIINTYPSALNKRHSKKEIEELLNKIDQLDIPINQDKTLIENEELNKKDKMLKEEDIQFLIQELDKII